jgi:CHAD domain-containing protein
VAYDRGCIRAGARRVAVDEIEFELIRGPCQALPDLAARWAGRFGLWWDVRTKAESGLRLALGLRQVEAVRAGPVVLAANASPAQAWSAMLHSALAQALPNAAEIAAGTATPEHLHQLRVALRRLRTALRVFAPWSGEAKAALALEAEWRLPFARLGVARDRDVLAGALRPMLAAVGASEFAAATQGTGPPPVDVVRGKAFTSLLLRTLALAHVPAPAAAADTGKPLAVAARECLGPLWRSVRRESLGFGQASAEVQHRTRRRLKRLRYAIEFLQPLLEPRATRRLREALSLALKALGELNDLHLAGARLGDQAANHPQAWFALGYLAARQEAAVGVAVQRLAELRPSRLAWRGA